MWRFMLALAWLVLLGLCGFFAAGCAGTSHPSHQATELACDDSASADTGLDVSALADEFVVRRLPASTCHGGPIDVPSSFHGPGRAVWHLCYMTPDERERIVGDEIVVRPTAVRFEVGGDLGFGLEPIVRVPAPCGTEPWTASIVVAFPASITPPRFNVRQELPPEFSGILWALNADGRGGLRARGQLRAWRVVSSGQQTAVALDRLFAICGGLQGPTGFPSGNFVPRGLCPALLRDCAPHPHHCRP